MFGAPGIGLAAPSRGKPDAGFVLGFGILFGCELHPVPGRRHGVPAGLRSSQKQGQLALAGPIAPFGGGRKPAYAGPARAMPAHKAVLAHDPQGVERAFSGKMRQPVHAGPAVAERKLAEPALDAQVKELGEAVWA